MQTLQRDRVEEEEAGWSGAEEAETITQEPRRWGSCTKTEEALARLSLVCFTVAVDSIPGESGRENPVVSVARLAHSPPGW